MGSNIIVQDGTFWSKIREGYYNKNGEKFQADIEKEYHMSNHPMKSKVFSLAWEHGHSSGYAEITDYYSDFVELLQPVEAVNPQESSMDQLLQMIMFVMSGKAKKVENDIFLSFSGQTQTGPFGVSVYAVGKTIRVDLNLR